MPQHDAPMCVCATYLGFTSCEPVTTPSVEPPVQDTIKPKPDINDYVEQLWQVRIVPPGTPALIDIHPLAHDQQVVMGIGKLTAWNHTDGQIMWSAAESGVNGIFGALSKWQDYIITLENRRRVAVFDGRHGTYLWHTELNQNEGACGHPRFNIIGNHIYHVHSTCLLEDTVSHMARSHVLEGRWDTVLTLRMENGYRPNIESISLWLNPRGDSVLIFQNRQLNFNTSKGKIDLHAYNLTQRRWEWRTNDIDSEGNSNVWAIYIYVNKVYFLGSRTVYCFSAHDGTLIWQRYFDGGSFEHFLGAANQIVADAQLLVKPSNRRLVALDPNSGAIIWDNNEGGAGPYQMVHYKGHVFYGSSGDNRGGVFVHRVSDGKMVHRIPRPFSNTVIRTIAINHETGQLFWSDGFFLRCYKIKL